MKKLLLLALVLFVGIVFVTTGFTQEKPKAAPEKPAAVEKPAPAKEEQPAETKEPVKTEQAEKPKPKPIPGFVGKVMSVDGMFVVVKGMKDSVTFDVSNAKFKGYKSASDIKVGDKVAMKYDKMGSLTVTKISGAKQAKEKKECAGEKKPMAKKAKKTEEKTESK
jgi:hypothetical protein